MSVLVVAYPTLAQPDYAWIQALRASHDSHYRLIPPHFTLVFPIDQRDPATVREHVVSCLRPIRHFACVLRCATIVKDSFSEKTHLFLVPDEGYSELVKLHDALYTRILAPELRLDVPYIPHITIGDHVDPHKLKPIADGINGQNICIHSQIEALAIVLHTNTSIETVETVQLA